MSLAERRRQGVESAMDNLSLASTAPSTSSHSSTSKPKSSRPAPIADSWDDEDATSSSGETTETEGPSIRNAIPGPPPPTPVTPRYKHSQTGLEFENPYEVKEQQAGSRSARADGSQPPRRQEKQTATASRLIAGALGVRAPKRTEEQRAYDRAVREREQKKRDEERRERRRRDEEVERAKASVWED